MTISRPSSASRSAVAPPIPRAPPVTIATRRSTGAANLSGMMEQSSDDSRRRHRPRGWRKSATTCGKSSVVQPSGSTGKSGDRASMRRNSVRKSILPLPGQPSCKCTANLSSTQISLAWQLTMCLPSTSKWRLTAARGVVDLFQGDPVGAVVIAGHPWRIHLVQNLRR